MTLNELKKITGTEGSEIHIQTLNRHSVRYRWVICPGCHKGRWVSIDQIHHKGYTGLCEPCYLEKTWGIKNYTGPNYIEKIIKEVLE